MNDQPVSDEPVIDEPAGARPATGGPVTGDSAISGPTTGAPVSDEHGSVFDGLLGGDSSQWAFGTDFEDPLVASTPPHPTAWTPQAWPRTASCSATTP